MCAMQRKPKRNSNPKIVDLVVKDMLQRSEVGFKTYGTYLQANNGRSALQDLYEELLDACNYIKQEIEERKNVQAKSRRKRKS